jgi:hypothetical protein
MNAVASRDWNGNRHDVSGGKRKRPEPSRISSPMILSYSDLGAASTFRAYFVKCR